MKKITFLLFFAGLITISNAQTSEIYAPNGKAIKGYDAVAFFTDGKPVAGADSLSFMYKNADWLFATRAHLEAFKMNPEKYAPQYGGYCAYGTSQGHKAPTETNTWSIVSDKLYFNYNQQVKNIWVKDQPNLINKADQQWPAIKDKQ